MMCILDTHSHNKKLTKEGDTVQPPKNNYRMPDMRCVISKKRYIKMTADYRISWKTATLTQYIRMGRVSGIFKPFVISSL